VTHTVAAVPVIEPPMTADRLDDPFIWRGPHRLADGRVMVRVVAPDADGAWFVPGDDPEVPWPLAALGDGCFEIDLGRGDLPTPDAYRIRLTEHGRSLESADPYAFGPVLGEIDSHLIAEGRHWRLWEVLGANPRTIAGIEGVHFAVWAPNARRASVVADFNHWDGRRHPMRRRHECGVFELFVPGVNAGSAYKFEFIDTEGRLVLKADPLARRTEVPPRSASIVDAPSAHLWTDAEWMQNRPDRHRRDAPMSVLEVHAGSWRRPNEVWPSFDWLAEHLVPYAVRMGYTHVELLPIAEHPFGGSWGYQPLSLYAPTGRLGDPDGLRRLVDRCHAAGLGVLLDWVPAHFPTDPHGLARFDGTALYEHDDPRLGWHQDWKTLVYNFGRREVANFLVANALFWLECFHVDGLRVDAVASMLYLDYSRRDGEWLPNRHGGRENLEAIAFLRELNDIIHEDAPAGAIMIAEESTSWPGVTHPTTTGGLGFDWKWNMGWMNDSLAYFREDPIHRRHHHDRLTFGLLYAWSEHFVLALSHDEVVHGKGSLLNKMPGDRWQRFANLRLLHAWQHLMPGKKLGFMGGEIAQYREWNHDTELDWAVLAEPLHSGVQQLVATLNRLHRAYAPLHAGDCDPAGFRWIACDDRTQSVLAWRRISPVDGSELLAVAHFTPEAREGYRIGVPRPGRWRVLLDTDARVYGGAGTCWQSWFDSEPVPTHGHPQSIALTLPGLAALLLECE
jgi:1,4-alpha-glucan branching enzyme